MKFAIIQHYCRYLSIKSYEMITNSTSTSPSVVKQFFKNFLQKLIQSPDIYPIKYYEKGKNIGKHKNAQLL